MSSLPYHIERTKNRTSRATIDGDGVLIRLARNLSLKEEQRHIDVLLKRMSKVHARLATTPLIDPFRTLLEGETSLSIQLENGKQILFDVTESHRTKAQETDSGFLIERSKTITKQSFHRFLWKLLSFSEQEYMEKKMHEINMRTLRLSIRNTKLRLTQSRWGSCSHSGKISLSTALLFVPTTLAEYVITHELCHILHPNHSKAFWRTVEEVMPDYKERLKELKKYRLPRI